MLGIDEEQTHVELRIGPKCLAQMRTIRIGLDTRILKLYGQGYPPGRTKEQDWEGKIVKHRKYILTPKGIIPYFLPPFPHSLSVAF